MSRKIEKTDKKIPNGSSGFSLNPGLTDCSDFPEQSTTYKQSGQSGPPLKTQIENLLRGIPQKVQVDVLRNLLCLLEQEDASFREKIDGTVKRIIPKPSLFSRLEEINSVLNIAKARRIWMNAVMLDELFPDNEI